MRYKIEINHKLPSLNEYIKAMNNNRHIGGRFKRNVQNGILWQLPNIKIKNLSLLTTFSMKRIKSETLTT